MPEGCVCLGFRRWRSLCGVGMLITHVSITAQAVLVITECHEYRRASSFTADHDWLGNLAPRHQLAIQVQANP